MLRAPPKPIQCTPARCIMAVPFTVDLGKGTGLHTTVSGLAASHRPPSSKLQHMPLGSLQRHTRQRTTCRGKDRDSAGSSGRSSGRDSSLVSMVPHGITNAFGRSSAPQSAAQYLPDQHRGMVCSLLPASSTAGIQGHVQPDRHLVLLEALQAA